MSFFLAIKRVQESVDRNDGLFLLWDLIKVSQACLLYTTLTLKFVVQDKAWQQRKRKKLFM